MINRNDESYQRSYEETSKFYKVEKNRIKNAKLNFLERLDYDEKSKIARKVSIDSYLMGRSDF